MARLVVENANVDFPVKLPRGHVGRISRTGGQIDAKHGVVNALRDVSFALAEGERLGLLGHNGAGKSTMLRLLAGVYPPVRGRVISVGRISTLFNSTPGLNLNGSGRENLITCGLHLGMTKRQIAKKLDEIIDFAELGDFIDLPVRIYSAGMVTRLGFSIATAVEPEILLLDEGLAAGDGQFARKATARMQELIARSSILVIASHSEALLAGMCSRCLLLEHGRVVMDGPPADLIRSYRSSVVESARSDDAEGLHRAYVLATEMAERGEALPLELEEQGLRYALTVAPHDAAMWQRYVRVLGDQGKPVTPHVEVSMILAVLGSNPARTDLNLRLNTIFEKHHAGLSDELRNRAAAVLRSSG